MRKSTPAIIRFVFLIHVSQHPGRWEAVKNTWLKDLPFDASFLTFSNGSSPFEKTRLAFERAVNQNPAAEWFIKADDDTYIYVKNLIKRLNPGSDYLGFPLKNGIPFASGGAGYILSKSAAVSVIECKPQITEYEDLAVAYCLNPKFPLVDLIGLHPSNPWEMLHWDRYGHPYDHIRQVVEPPEGYLYPLSYHYVPKDVMYHMHQHSGNFPKNIHQFSINANQNTGSCRDVLFDWDYSLWNDEILKTRFPSGNLIHQDIYDKSNDRSLKSYILSHEILLFFGGLYIDSDSNCNTNIVPLLTDFNDGFVVLENEDNDKLLKIGIMALRPFSGVSMLAIQQLPRTNLISVTHLFTNLLSQFNISLSNTPLVKGQTKFVL